jgi:hypothetical protein
VNISAFNLAALRTRSAPAGCVVSLIAMALMASACGSSTIRQGQGSSYLILVALEGGNGAEGNSARLSPQPVSSDVITFVRSTNSFSIVLDPGRATFRLAMKDVTNPNAPTENNSITINRYRVVYTRADGRNTPGVDVPYAFDSAVTATIAGGESVQVPFELVRIQSKMEPPLVAMSSGGGAIAISTLAEVTFYGRDQTGREVSVSGTIGVNFANWGDPTS